MSHIISAELFGKLRPKRGHRTLTPSVDRLYTEREQRVDGELLGHSGRQVRSRNVTAGWRRRIEISPQFLLLTGDIGYRINVRET